MEIIIHRINKIKELNSIPVNFGIEIDIRANGSNLILNHEPYSKGTKLEDFLNNYNHGTLVLNIKESGIEDDVLKIVKKNKIKSFFLLDIEMPYLYSSSQKNEKNLAVRLSEYEDIITAKFFIKKINWIWVDTVSKLPINQKNIKIIKNYKSCLVCPERWGRPNDIKKYLKYFSKINFFPNAVMTSMKYAQLWQAND